MLFLTKTLQFIIVILLVCTVEVSSSADYYTISARGCCSRNGGVCGCVNGKVKCCNGKLSPTCRCD